MKGKDVFVGVSDVQSKILWITFTGIDNDMSVLMLSVRYGILFLDF